MRRVLGSWAGDHAEVHRGAGAGQGHRSGRGQAEVTSGRRPRAEGASPRGPGRAPSESPHPDPAASPPRHPHARHAAPRRFGGVGARPWSQEAPRSAGSGGPAGRRVAEAAPRWLARARSLPAVTFRAVRPRGGRVRASAHLRRPQRELPGPRAAQQTPGPRTGQPRAPRAQHRPAKRSRRRRRHLGLCSAAAAPDGPCGTTRVQSSREPGAGAGLESVSRGQGAVPRRCGSRPGNQPWAGPVVITAKSPVTGLSGDAPPMPGRPRLEPKASPRPSRAFIRASLHPARGGGAGPAPGVAGRHAATAEPPGHAWPLHNSRTCRKWGAMENTDLGGEGTALPQLQREVLRILYSSFL